MTINLVNPPAGALGKPGDTIGMMAIASGNDGGTLYLCVANYDGVSRIWIDASKLGVWIPIEAPPAPIITSYVTSGGNASNLFPIVSGTTVLGKTVTGTKNPKVEVLMYVNGNLHPTSATVNGTNWTWQPSQSLIGGTHILTAAARYVNESDITLGLASPLSASSSPFNITLTASAPNISITVRPRLPAVFPPNTWQTQVSWTATNATSVTLDGIPQNLTGIATYLSSRRMFRNLNFVVSGPGGTVTKQLTIALGQPLPGKT
jgi:hypothetical protein